MVDTAINSYPVETSDVSKLYAEKAAGNLVRVSIDKLASSVSGAATGQTFYVDASGNVVKRAIGSNGAIMVASSGLPNWLAPGPSTALLYANASQAPTWSGTGTTGQFMSLSGAVPTWADNPARLRFIQSQTGSAVAAIDFTTGFDSTYDEYIFVLVGVYPSTADARIDMRGSIDAGATFISAANYEYVTLQYSSATGAAGSASGTGTEFRLTNVTGPNNAAAAALAGRVNLVLSSTRAAITSNGYYRSSVPNYYSMANGGALATASIVNGVRFLASSGNINGTIRMYGVKNA